MNRLPKGKFLTEETSPNGKYTLKTYLINGGATTSSTIRGELVFHKRNDQTKNIYWNEKEEIAKIHWLDDETVDINGHVLYIHKDRFDFRRQ